MSLAEDEDNLNRIYGGYELQFNGAFVDSVGRLLDGEWTAPILGTPTPVISGDNYAGGTFVFNVVLLPGDIDNDLLVGFADLGILLNNYNQAGTFTTGDLNGDGVVDFADLGMLLNWYGFPL